MKLTSYFQSLLAFSAFVHALPVSENDNSLAPRAECDDGTYGKQITKQEYIDYLKKYYPGTDKYMLYSTQSDNQAINFQGLNPGYFWYDDFFKVGVSKNYEKAFPPHPTIPDCWRLDDGEASSAAIATAATGDIIAFGAVEWQTKGERSYFATKEIPDLRKNIRAGGLSKITHMLKDATKRDQVLATEDADGKQTFAQGHSPGETNASGTFGDCSDTLEPPTCDNPTEGIWH